MSDPPSFKIKPLSPLVKLNVIKEVSEVSDNEIEKLPPVDGLSAENLIEKMSPLDKLELNFLETVVEPPKSSPALIKKDLLEVL